MFAETVSLNAGVLLLALLLYAAGFGAVVAGFVCAPRAGRGSRGAAVVWAVALVLEGSVFVASLRPLFDGQLNLFLLLPAAVIAAQMLLFVRGRAR